MVSFQCQIIFKLVRCTVWCSPRACSVRLICWAILKVVRLTFCDNKYIIFRHPHIKWKKCCYGLDQLWKLRTIHAWSKALAPFKALLLQSCHKVLWNRFTLTQIKKNINNVKEDPNLPYCRETYNHGSNRFDSDDECWIKCRYCQVSVSPGRGTPRAERSVCRSVASRRPCLRVRSRVPVGSTFVL